MWRGELQPWEAKTALGWMLTAGIRQACCGSSYFQPCAQRSVQLWAMRKKITVQHVQEHLVCFHTSRYRAVGMLHLNSVWIRHLLWFIAINMVCINSGWQSPDGIYSCSCDPTSSRALWLVNFPQERGQRQSISQDQRVPAARRSLSLCLLTCTSCT